QAVPTAPQAPQASPEALFDLHAGFRNGRTVVLHKFGTDPNYDSWRGKVLGQPGSQPVAVLPGGEAINLLPTALPVRQQGGGAVVQTRVAPQVAAEALFASQVVQQTRKLNGAIDNTFNPAAAERMQRVRSLVLANNAPAGQTLAVGPFVVTRSQRNPTALFG